MMTKTLSLLVLFMAIHSAGFAQTPRTSNLTRTASFPGGIEALQKYLLARVYYPECSREIGAVGTATVRVVIDENGKTGQISLLQGIPSDCHNIINCDSSILRAIRQMPAWQPARYNGQPVKSVVAIPVEFSIE